MEKVRNVSDAISYDDLRKRFFNSYSEANNDNKRKLNDKNRQELEIILDELIKGGPLFSKVEIQHLTNHRWNDENGKEYIGEVEIIRFYDFNTQPIKERMNIIKKEEVRKEVNYGSFSSSSTWYGGYSNNGYLEHRAISPPPTPIPEYNPLPSMIPSIVANTALIATVVSAPVAIGISALSVGAGYLLGKIFS